MKSYTTSTKHIKVDGKGLYTLKDVALFSPSTAIYFMDGTSEATVRILATGQEFTLKFHDGNTSISATEPMIYSEPVLGTRVYLAAPEPLKPFAYFPRGLPDKYKRNTTMHLLQVISMNMRDQDSGAALLIGLPYVEKYPELFFRRDLFEHGAQDASSYGVVSSLTDFTDPITGRKEVDSNGYPARSAFAIFHILETTMGTFFNKKPTIMELQPDKNGKLALRLPPIPFNYDLINGPIPLYDIRSPNGDPIAAIIVAHHRSDSRARRPTETAWPWHKPNLEEIDARLRGLKVARD